MKHEHYVGSGTLSKMQELDDQPATCEQYPFSGDTRDEVSLCWGISGRMYVYLKQVDKVEVYETIDVMLAGGTP